MIPTNPIQALSMLYTLHGGFLQERMVSELDVYETLKTEGRAITICHWKELPAKLERGDIVAFRLVWGYDKEADLFFQTIDNVARQPVRLIPDERTLLWNVHKKYLFDLQNSGVSMPKCWYHESGKFDTRVLNETTVYVIKPAVSAGARGILKGTGQQIKSGELVVQDDVIVQEFSTSVHSGERSLIFFDGKFSHAVRKTPAPNDFRVQLMYGGKVDVFVPSKEEITWAAKVLQKTPVLFDYARVDYLVDGSSFLLMELELIEPELFLTTAEHKLRYAALVRSWFEKADPEAMKMTWMTM